MKRFQRPKHMLIKIDQVPLPDVVHGSGSTPIYPWKTMKVGDSFLFRKSSSKTCNAQAWAAGYRYRRKFAIRTMPEGIRCWRIA